MAASGQIAEMIGAKNYLLGLWWHLGPISGQLLRT
jgi:hypothetical protein